MIRRKGILLAGGRGSGLRPATLVLNKQLLPVFDQPMIYFPLTTLMWAGIQDIMLVTNPQDLDLFHRLLGDGSNFGINLQYVVQDQPRGLPDAVLKTRTFVGDDHMAVALGDNLLDGPALVPHLRHAGSRPCGASLFVTRVSDPQRFGVVTLDASGRPIALDEKPTVPVSSDVAIGLYFYDTQVWEHARNLQPSKRGELEITDLNERYRSTSMLFAERLESTIRWLDMGTPDSLADACEFVRTHELQTGTKPGCPEAVAFHNGWISSEELDCAARRISGPYGRHLQSLNF